MKYTLLNDKTIKASFMVFSILLAMIAIVKMVFSLFMLDINADAAYYLGVSRLILEGNMPFIDFPPGYTPLSFYIMAVPIAVFGTSFTIALVCLYLLHIANSGIIYKIIRQNNGDKLMASYFSVLSLLLCLGTDGYRYVLEPFVLFFGLLALYILKKGGFKWIVLSGFLCFCSFWSKQYGLGFICLAISALLLEGGMNKTFFFKSAYLMMGFFVGMVLFVLFFLVQGVDPLSLLSLSGSSYERDGISGLIGGGFSLLITVPLLLVAIITMFTKLKDARNISLLIVSFFGVFGFMLQCYVRFYAHYLMLAMPFAVLMLYACFDAFKSEKLKKIYTILLLLSTLIPFYFASKSVVAVIEENAREKQEVSAKAISDIVPNGSKDVYCAMDLLPFMHLNTYDPPLIRKYGMSNGFVRDSDEAAELIHAAYYCMISERDFEKKNKYTPEVLNCLKERFDMRKIEGKDPKETYYIYVRKEK